MNGFIPASYVPVFDLLRLLYGDIEKHQESHITDSQRPANAIDKDKYMDNVNPVGIKLINNYEYYSAELFYDYCLGVIKDFENNNKGKRLNRGITLGNLGVAQVALGKYEEGICNLMAAALDDISLLGGDLQVNYLFPQFEKIENEKLMKLLFSPNNPYEFKELYSFLERLNVEKRLFQFLIISRINISLKKLDENDENTAAKAILFNALREQCLLFEQIIRESRNVAGGTYGKFLIDTDLIQDATNCSSNNDSEFEQHLSSIVSSSSSANEKSFKISLCIRNFNSHNFNLNSSTFFSERKEITKYSLIECYKILDQKGLI